MLEKLIYIEYFLWAKHYSEFLLKGDFLNQQNNEHSIIKNEHVSKIYLTDSLSPPSIFCELFHSSVSCRKRLVIQMILVDDMQIEASGMQLINALWILISFPSGHKFFLFLICTYTCVVLWILQWMGCNILSNCFPRWLDHFAFPPSVYESSSSSTSLITLGMVSLFGFSNFNRCVATSQCGINLYLHNNDDIECLFMDLYAIYISSLLKCPFKSFAHFYWVVYFQIIECLKFFLIYITTLGVIYGLDTSPSSVIFFANVFSHFVISLFILWLVSFKEQTCLILIKFHLPICSFMNDAFVVIYIRNLCLNQTANIFFCVFFFVALSCL